MISTTSEVIAKLAPRAGRSLGNRESSQLHDILFNLTRSSQSSEIRCAALYNACFISFKCVFISFFISLFREFSYFFLSCIFLQINPVILHRGHLVSNKRHHPSDISHSIPEPYAFVQSITWYSKKIQHVKLTKGFGARWLLRPCRSVLSSGHFLQAGPV